MNSHNPKYYFSRSKSEFVKIDEMNSIHLNNAVNKLSWSIQNEVLNDTEKEEKEKSLECMKKELSKRHKQMQINKLRQEMSGYWIDKNNKLWLLQDLDDGHILSILGNYPVKRAFKSGGDGKLPSKYYEIKIEALRRGLIDK